MKGAAANEQNVSQFTPPDHDDDDVAADDDHHNVAARATFSRE